MKMHLALALAALLPFTASGSGATAAPSPYVSSQPGLEVSAKKHGAAEGTFVITALLRDTSTGEILANPTMVVRAGHWASASIGVDGVTSAVAFSATVDPSGTLVAFLAKASQSDGDKRSYSGTALVAP